MLAFWKLAFMSDMRVNYVFHLSKKTIKTVQTKTGRDERSEGSCLSFLSFLMISSQHMAFLSCLWLTYWGKAERKMLKRNHTHCFHLPQSSLEVRVRSNADIPNTFLCLFKISGGSVAGELCRSQYKGQFSWPKAVLDRRQKTFNPTCQINNLFAVVRRKTPLSKRAKFVLANDHISLC